MKLTLQVSKRPAVSMNRKLYLGDEAWPYLLHTRHIHTQPESALHQLVKQYQRERLLVEYLHVVIGS